MDDAKRVLIIIPAWNEAESIGDVVREVRTKLPTVDVLVVSDGSTDRTAAEAAEAGAVVATLPYNLGVGGAMRLGYRYARDHDYDVAVQVDADGQHDPGCVPQLIAELGDGPDGAALVAGARFAGMGDYKVSGPRRWAMLMLSFVLSRMAKTKLPDTTSGFRACNRALIELFAIWYPVEYLGDTVETTVRVIRLGYKVRQIPVAMRPRAAGKSSASPIKAMVYLGRAMLTLALALNRR
jgi:glycosyltransferase involved in cell wall biosynthesis